MVSHPELGSDPPIGSDRESGRDIPGPSGVSPSRSPYLRSPLPHAMETSPEGPLAVKPTREELQACV